MSKTNGKVNVLEAYAIVRRDIQSRIYEMEQERAELYAARHRLDVLIQGAEEAVEGNAEQQET